MTASPCADRVLLIQAELDGELDAAGSAALQTHLEGCAGCRAVQADLRALSAGLRREAPRHPAPERLRTALAAHLEPPPRPALRVVRHPALAFGAGAALAAGVAAGVALAVLPVPPATLDDQAVADHIRALQPGHLTDVESSDRHMVRPWFDGRIDYAPPVRDFAAAGFPLIGGRLDYLGGRPVAALVYRRDRHLIDLYVWPATGEAAPVPRTRNGYAVVGWRAGGMAFLAVSDLEAAQLLAFARLWEGGA
jgi:anti-sigma factor RsiW